PSLLLVQRILVGTNPDALPAYRGRIVVGYLAGRKQVRLRRPWPLQRLLSPAHRHFVEAVLAEQRATALVGNAEIGAMCFLVRLLLEQRARHRAGRHGVVARGAHLVELRLGEERTTALASRFVVDDPVQRAALVVLA